MIVRSSSVKIKSYKNGIMAEYLCAIFLMLKGYRIITMRYKTKVGEVDIIAKSRNVLVFAEVKFRHTFDDAMEAVHNRTQSRIRRTAEHYLLEQSRKSDRLLNMDVRFDVMAVSNHFLIRHMKNAF